MEKAETIDLYLLRLGVALSRRFPNDENMVLRIVSETEDHLRQAVEKNRDAGLAPSEAEREAIRQFGSPETVAERFGRELGGAPLSPLGLPVRSYLHLGALVGTVVAAAGAACLVLSAFAAVFGPMMVFDMADPPPGYYLPQCESFTPQDIALGQECTWERWGPQAAVSHLWLTVSGAAALAVGAAVWAAHRALLWRYVGGWEDQSLPARVHAVLGMLFFGLAGLLLWPSSLAAIFSRDVSLEPLIASSLAAGAPVTAIFFLAYVRYARSVYALRA